MKSLASCRLSTSWLSSWEVIKDQNAKSFSVKSEETWQLGEKVLRVDLYKVSSFCSLIIGHP